MLYSAQPDPGTRAPRLAVNRLPQAAAGKRAAARLQPGNNRDNAAAGGAGHTILQLRAGTANGKPLRVHLIGGGVAFVEH